jgi:thiol-disulfide isomerase/thioredoxin
MERNIKMKIAKYFSAVWCGPCKAFKPIMKEIQSEGHNVQFIDIDSSPELAEAHGIRSVPTIVIEENGAEVDRLVGSLPKAQVLSKLN